MNAKFAWFAAFACAMPLLMLPNGHPGAASPACYDASSSCSQPSNAQFFPKPGFRVAQVPALSDSGPNVVIRQPKAEVPRKAFKALDRHCARCHQQGRLKRAKPAKNLGNILKLDEIARDPHLVLPGNPDGSRLFSRIVKQEMPYDVYTEFSGGDEPGKEDVQAIYDWIESLDKKSVVSCGNRKPVDADQIVNAISENLNKISPSRRTGMRYLTLTNFYNACARNDELRRMHNGVKLLLNSLSRAPQETLTANIGTGGSIISFNLDDLGWSAEDWDTLLAAYPYGARPKSRTFDEIKERTKTSLPYLRADWFAAAASSPPLYYKLLDLPDDLGKLQAALGVNAEQNIANGRVVRAGIWKSTVSRYNRVIERHPVGSGYLWMTYDFDGASAKQSAKERPLGPGGERGFVHDMNAVIFSLPNGMNAFFLGDENGARIDAAPPDILHDEAFPRRPVVVGLSCISCHANGARGVTDNVRAYVETSAKFAAARRDEILRIYARQDELDRRISDDRTRYKNAATKAGIRLKKGNDGLDDLSYLASRYGRNVDLRIAAAEYGVTKNRYASGLAKGSKDALRTKQQLEQGTMKRRELEPLFLKHVALVSNDIPSGRVKAPETRPAKPPLARLKKVAKGKPAEPLPDAKKKSKPAPKKKVAATSPKSSGPSDGDQTIMLVSDKTLYRANDLPVFSVKASADCLLTLINVDPSGQAVVIFPNKYQQDNLIKARKEFRFPGADAPFQFRLKDIGKEKLIAECAIKKDGERIQHNFEQQEFTDLGDYRDHVGEQAGKNSEKKSAGARTTDLLRTAITFTVK